MALEPNGKMIMMYLMGKGLWPIIALMMLTSCSGEKGGDSAAVTPEANGSDGVQGGAIYTEENGVVTGRITVAGNVPNIIYASDSSSIAGTSAEFPPGTFNAKDGDEVTVALESGAPLPNDSLQSELNLGDNVGVIASAPPSLITSSESDLNGAMVLNILLPTVTSLRFYPLEQHVVFYRVWDENGKVIFGVKNFADADLSFDFSDGVVRILTYRFGWYQAAVLNIPLAQSILGTAIYPIQSELDWIANQGTEADPALVYEKELQENIDIASELVTSAEKDVTVVEEDLFFAEETLNLLVGAQESSTEALNAGDYVTALEESSSVENYQSQINEILATHQTKLEALRDQYDALLNVLVSNEEPSLNEIISDILENLDNYQEWLTQLSNIDEQANTISAETAAAIDEILGTDTDTALQVTQEIVNESENYVETATSTGDNWLVIANETTTAASSQSEELQDLASTNSLAQSLADEATILMEETSNLTNQLAADQLQLQSINSQMDQIATSINSDLSTAELLTFGQSALALKEEANNLLSKISQDASLILSLQNQIYLLLEEAKILETEQAKSDALAEIGDSLSNINSLLGESASLNSNTETLLQEMNDLKLEATQIAEGIPQANTLLESIVSEYDSSSELNDLITAKLSELSTAGTKAAQTTAAAQNAETLESIIDYRDQVDYWKTVALSSYTAAEEALSAIGIHKQSAAGNLAELKALLELLDDESILAITEAAEDSVQTASEILETIPQYISEISANQEQAQDLLSMGEELATGVQEAEDVLAQALLGAASIDIALGFASDYQQQMNILLGEMTALYESIVNSTDIDETLVLNTQIQYRLATIEGLGIQTAKLALDSMEAAELVITLIDKIRAIIENQRDLPCDNDSNNLLTNGCFESPALAEDVYSSLVASDETGWQVEWVNPDRACSGILENPSPVLEIQKQGFVKGLAAAEGMQWAELDAGCIEVSEENPIALSKASNIRISQLINTTPGAKYKIEFLARSRIGYNRYIANRSWYEGRLKFLGKWMKHKQHYIKQNYVAQNKKLHLWAHLVKKERHVFKSIKAFKYFIAKQSRQLQLEVKFGHHTIHQSKAPIHKWVKYTYIVGTSQAQTSISFADSRQGLWGVGTLIDDVRISLITED